MRTSLPLLVLLAACEGRGSIEIGDDAGATDTDIGGGGGVTNGGGGGGGNGGGGNGGGGTVDTDGGGGTADTDLDPFGPDPLAWDGRTVFTFVPFQGRPCELTAVEAGEQVYGAGYLQMERACPSCQRVFTVPAEIRGLCVTSMSSPTTFYRGLEFLGGGQVKVWRLSQSGSRWTSEPLATGTLTGDVLTFTYKSSELGYKRVDVSAEVTLD